MKSGPKVKICCISSIAEARLAVQYGASAIGLVSEMPSGPGVIPEARIREIAESAPPAVGVFLLTSRQSADEIIEQQKRCRVNTIQICDSLEPGAHRKIKAALPGISIVQVIHVTGEAALEEAERVAPDVDAILLDSGNPSLPVKELGGTGRIHDWEISRRIRKRVACPIFLAGGLNAHNVVKAIETVKPYGIDVCSGVRTGDKLDEEKLTVLFQSIWRAIRIGL
jgi:phosphoribosylanthranilate isomerase